MSKKLLLTAVLVFWPSYSSSDSTAPYYGTTPNAAAGGTTWDMSTVLPTPSGLDINGVIYNYTIQKDVNDAVDVHVQNKNADGTGYIFRETDEWQVGSLGGTEIRKVVPVIPNISRQSWGEGSIEVEGNGSVKDPTVLYMYKVDPCYDPQFSPACPGYELELPELPDPFSVDELYSLLNESIELVNNDTDLEVYNDEEESSEEDEEDEEREKMRLEAALAAVDNSEMFANAFAQAQMLAAMNNAIQMSSYYTGNVPGGTYNETQVMVDKKIEDNKQGLRNGFAQQLLHEQMIQEQYN